MNPNLVIIGFDNQFISRLGKYVADRLDMLYADVLELIEYNLVNSKEALLRCGREYIEKEERKTISAVSEYENAVISIPYDIFINNSKYVSKDSFIVCVISNNISSVDKIALAERCEVLKSLTDDIIHNQDGKLDTCFNQIVNSLKGANK